MAKTEVALLDTEIGILEAITLKKEELTDWVKTADNYVVTPQTLKEADTFRKKGKNFRLEIQRIAKANNDKLNKLKKINSDREDEFIIATGLEAAEKRLDAKIKAVEEEAERIEKERKNAIVKRINEINAKVQEVRTITDIETLKVLIPTLEEFTDSFEEFNEPGNDAIKTTIAAIQNRIAILEDEAHLKMLREAKINSRKEMLANYPKGYWPTDEELGAYSQELFEEAIIRIEANIKADQEDEQSNDAPSKTKQLVELPKNSTIVSDGLKTVIFESEQHGNIEVEMPISSGPYMDGSVLPQIGILSEEKGFLKHAVVSPIAKSAIDDVDDYYASKLEYSGWVFSIPAKLPNDARTKIIDFIKEVLDEIPM